MVASVHHIFSTLILKFVFISLLMTAWVWYFFCISLAIFDPIFTRLLVAKHLLMSLNLVILLFQSPLKHNAIRGLEIIQLLTPLIIAIFLFLKNNGLSLYQCKFERSCFDKKCPSIVNQRINLFYIKH